MTVLDLSKVYLSPNEQDPKKQDGVIRQLLEFINNGGLGFFIVRPSGDTTGATDLNNINTAITFAATNGFNTVQLVPGTYYVNNSITLAQDNIRIIGASLGDDDSAANGSTIIQGTTNNAVIFIGKAGTQLNGIEVRNLTLIGSSSGSNSHCLSIDSSSHGVIDKVFMSVQAASAVGLRMVSAESGLVIAAYTISNISIALNSNANAIGIYLDNFGSGLDVNNCTFLNITIHGNAATQRLINLRGCDTNYFHGCSLFADTALALAAIYLDYGGSIHPTNNMFFGVDWGFQITPATAIVVAGSPSNFDNANPNLCFGMARSNGGVDPNLTIFQVITGGSWNSYTPTITSGTGSSTGSTVSTNARYFRSGTVVNIEGFVTVTATGASTPGGAIKMTLPLNANSNANLAAFNAATLNTCSGFIDPNVPTVAQFFRYDGASLWTGGNSIRFSGVYESTS